MPPRTWSPIVTSHDQLRGPTAADPDAEIVNSLVLTDLVKTTVYVASHDRDDLVTAWDVVSRHFGAHDVPSTLLGVAVLGYRDQLVEVEAVAALR